MSNPPTLDVVVVNWNSGGYLKNCINALLIAKKVLANPVQIIVVDNSSNDGSTEFLEHHQDVKLYMLSQNRGFAAACNHGARHSDARYLLFLNPDTRVHEDTLSGVIRYMEEDRNGNVAIAGVKLIDDAGRTARCCARIPNATQLLCHTIGLDRVFPRTGYIMADWDHETTRSVDHVIGAFYLIRQEVFTQLGGFDERFFVYLEDLDLSLRVQRSGWHCMYFSELSCFHSGGGCSRQIKSTRLFYALRSRFIFGYKHFSIPVSAAILLCSLIVEFPVRMLDSARKLSPSGLKATALAYWKLLVWLIVSLVNIKKC